MKTIDELNYERLSPENELADFVKCFWRLENTGAADVPVTILPDGYFDILFVSVDGKPFRPYLIGLATIEATFTVLARSTTYSVSFKLPAAEYILKTNISPLLDKRQRLPYDFWQLYKRDFYDLETFAKSVSAILTKSLHEKTDPRKLALFDTIYQTNGAIRVEELAEAIAWSSRQINRYFHSSFGLPLKKYCNILRFRSSFEQLHSGTLSPSPAYFDQPHFIREVNRFSGTSPRQLANNKKDRFIQLSTLDDG